MASAEQLLKPQQRQEMNAFVTRANAYIEQRRKSKASIM
jgi:hypothetical protein